MDVRLEVSHSKSNVKRVVLRSDTLIGRGPECNLRIASTEVSRRHCKIIVTDDTVLVRDLGSSNGTFVDGIQIEAEIDVAVEPGSELSVGGVKFLMHFDPPVLAAADLEPDAAGSTLDFRRQTDDVQEPVEDSIDTVYHSPEETVREAARPARDRSTAARAALAEPATEMLRGDRVAPTAGNDELTVVESLPQPFQAIAPPAGPERPGGPEDPHRPDPTSGDDLFDFFQQFE
jgi:hypothetical protein